MLKITQRAITVGGMVMVFFLLGSGIVLGDEYRDMGGPNDFSSAQNIFFDIESDFGGDGWPFYWYLSPNNDFPGSFAWYEKDNEFRWATAPANTNGWISSRAIRYRHFGRFRVVSSSFSLSGTGRPQANLHLTIRYKDDIRPGNFNGCPVFSWNGAEWVNQGLIGGEHDHAWKTKQFVIEPNEVKSVSNHFIFKIGVSIYSDEIIGELPIDKIKLADDTTISEFEADQPGVWPDSPPSRFANLGKTQEFAPGAGPCFPFGIHNSGLWISDGGSATTAGHGARDSWQVMEDARMNIYSFHGWEQNWYSLWNQYPNEFSWDNPGVAVELGLDEHLIQAAGHNLKVFPNTYTDTQAWWIKQQYSSEQKTLDYLAKVAYDHRNHPALGAWYLIDEWDHEDGFYGKPHIFSHQLATKMRIADPNTPILFLSMGFMGTSTWKITSESADIVVVDVYPVEPFSYNDGLKLQASRLDDMRATLGNDGAYMLMGMGYNYNDGSIWKVDNQNRGLTTAEIVAQAYMGITHGSKGMIYWCGLFGHPEFRSSNWSVSNSKRIWDGFRQVGNELFGNEGIAPVLLTPSTTLEIMGEKGIVRASASDIHFILKQTQEGQKYLIALRASNTTSGKVTFTIGGLQAGTTIHTRFENGRTIVAENGRFSDNFESLERHVYQLGEVTTGSGSNDLSPTTTHPKSNRLYPNYPNPFNPETKISYELVETGWVNLTIYNLLGSKVITLQNGRQHAGSYQIAWQGLDQFGQPVGSGVYFCQLQFNDQMLNSQKMILMK